MKYADLPCVTCGRVLDPTWWGDDYAPVNDALIFRAYGQFGSDYDPMTDQHLVIVICDPCIKILAQQERVIEAFPQSAPPPSPKLLYHVPQELDEDEEK